MYIYIESSCTEHVKNHTEKYANFSVRFNMHIFYLFKVGMMESDYDDDDKGVKYS